MFSQELIQIITWKSLKKQGMKYISQENTFVVHNLERAS